MSAEIKRLVKYEKVGKYVIAECLATKVCGGGLSNDEALAHLEEELVVYAADSKKPFYEARRAIRSQIMGELTWLHDSGSDNRITQLMAALKVLEH